MAFTDATDDSVSDSFARLKKASQKPKEPRVELAQAATTASDAGGGQVKTEYPEITAAKAKIEYEDALKRQSEGKAAAEKARQASIYEEYKPQLTQRFEQFQPPKDTFQGLASLGIMMMAIGSMGGKKGLTSATGAMNAIAGMATGYQQGRKEEFDRQKQIFDENFRIMKENQAQVEKEFQYALKYAKTNLAGATNYARAQAAARGDSATVASIDKNGLVKTAADHSQAYTKYNEFADKKKAFQDAQLAVLRKELEQKEETAKRTKEKEDLEKRLKEAQIGKAEKELVEGSSAERRAKEERRIIAEGLKANNIRPRNEKEILAWTERFPNEPFPKEVSKEAEGIKGQIRFVKNYLGSEADELGVKELPKVASTIESAKLAKDLADRIQKNPQAAGVVGNTLAFFDKFIPSRYQPTDIADPDRLAIEASTNPEIFKGIPADKISDARDIQKMMIDVINARALAASGGSRMLVSEFNAQKGALGLSDLSPQSAINLYNNVVKRDINALKQYGISDAGIDSISKKINVSSQPQTTVAPRKLFNNRIITVRDGKWVYEDTGEEAK